MHLTPSHCARHSIEYSDVVVRRKGDDERLLACEMDQYPGPRVDIEQAGMSVTEVGGNERGMAIEWPQAVQIHARYAGFTQEKGVPLATRTRQGSGGDIYSPEAIYLHFRLVCKAVHGSDGVAGHLLVSYGVEDELDLLVLLILVLLTAAKCLGLRCVLHKAAVAI